MLATLSTGCNIVVNYGAFTKDEINELRPSDIPPRVISFYLDGALIMPTSNSIWWTIINDLNICADHHYGEETLLNPATVEMMQKSLLETIKFITNLHNIKKNQNPAWFKDMSIVDQIELLTNDFKDQDLTHTKLGIAVNLIIGNIFYANLVDPDTGLSIIIPNIISYLINIISTDPSNIAESIEALTTFQLDPRTLDTVIMAIKSENRPNEVTLDPKIVFKELKFRSQNIDFKLGDDQEYEILINTINHILRLGSTNVTIQAEQLLDLITNEQELNLIDKQEINELIKAIKIVRERTNSILTQIKGKTLEMYKIFSVEINDKITFHDQISTLSTPQ